MSDGSIVAAADAVVVLEQAEIFRGLSRMVVGDTIADPALRRFLGPVPHTNTVRSFSIRDAGLHAKSMMLLHGGHRLTETRYEVPDGMYAEARLGDEVVHLSDETPVVIGFNKDWWGYYHWLAQCLPAIDWAFRQEANVGARVALPALQPWQSDLLDLLGHGAAGRIIVDSDSCYAIPRAVYVEHLNGSTALGISRTAVQTFQRLRKRARVRPLPCEILYVARTDSRRRVMRNEETLVRLLEAEGASIVVPGQLNIVDQISRFSGAKIVIGAHGGGLTNLVFCADDATVYELLPSHYPNPCFNRLAQAKGLDYWTDMFPSDGEGGIHGETWEVDIELFKRRLDAIRMSVRSPVRVETGHSPVPVHAPEGGLLSFFFSQGRSRPINTWRHYFGIYERYLARFRGTDPTMVQLGVEEGGKLAMWRAYFGAGCRLFGIDNNPKAVRHGDVATGIFIGDQRDPTFVRDVLREIGRPDIVINDGAHSANQQITAFEVLYPGMSEDGVYIVEDTHTSLWGGALMDRPDGLSFLVHAYLRCAELMSWTGNVANYEVLGTELGAQLWNQASEFCRMTREISFLDSMIVFERGRRSVPRHEER